MKRKPLEKIVVITLFIQTIIVLISLLKNPERFTSFINFYNNIGLTPFLATIIINELISISAIILTFTGLIILSFRKRIEISYWLKIPILIYSLLFLRMCLHLIYNTELVQIELLTILDISFNLLLIISYSLYCRTITLNFLEKNSITVSNILFIRFINFFIDISFLLFFSLVSFSFLKEKITFSCIFLSYSFLYYSLFELLYRQTLSKLFTKTYVLNNKSLIISILLRTASRHIPLEPFSFFFRKKGRWHDRISDTELIKLRDLNETNGIDKE